jgi:hypothetical protein
MADRRILPDDVPVLWAGATAAGRRSVVRHNGEQAVSAALACADALRTNQLPPEGDWSIWVILAGRGFGKTRAGAEWLHAMALERPRRFALVGTSLDNARAVMVEGESGLLARMPQGGDVSFVASQRLLSWPNGSQARLFSGGEPDSLRGGQFDFAWVDEFAHWPHAEATLTNLRLATRLGVHPRLLLTTTPLPHAWLKQLSIFRVRPLSATAALRCAEQVAMPSPYLPRTATRGCRDERPSAPGASCWVVKAGSALLNSISTTWHGTISPACSARVAIPAARSISDRSPALCRPPVPRRSQRACWRAARRRAGSSASVCHGDILACVPATA